MAYEILRGIIKKKEVVEGTTYYTIQCGYGDAAARKMAFNVRHGFQFDPSGGNAVYDEGTSVYVAGIVTSTGVQDGVILAAVRPRAGGSMAIESKLKPIYDKLKEDGGDSAGAEGLTPGDIFYRRGNGVFKFAYNGLFKILSKIGLGWIMDPSGDKMHGYANNFEFTLGNYGTIRSEINKESKTALLHFDFINSVDQMDSNGSLITLDIGEVNRTGRIALNVIDATDPTGQLYRAKLLIDKDGRVEILAKDTTINISSDSGLTKAAEIKVDEEGNAIVKTETFKLGKGTTDQSMVRGVKFAENYNGLIDIIKVVLPSAPLQIAAEDKKIYDGVSPELSTTNKID
jgi:hypothetical protein